MQIQRGHARNLKIPRHTVEGPEVLLAVQLEPIHAPRCPERHLGARSGQRLTILNDLHAMRFFRRQTHIGYVEQLHAPNPAICIIHSSV